MAKNEIYFSQLYELDTVTSLNSCFDTANIDISIIDNDVPVANSVTKMHIYITTVWTHKQQH